MSNNHYDIQTFNNFDPIPLGNYLFRMFLSLSKNPCAKYISKLEITIYPLISTGFEFKEQELALF